MSEEIKYEQVFGDQSLFDGAPDDVDMIGYSGGFYKNSKDGPMYCCGCTFTTDEYRNKGFIAMRRIIKDKVDDENELENLYWEFDSQRSKKTTDERLLFKGKLRYYASIASVDKSTKEPNRWTWEDKDAGRLPEVGCRVDFCHKLNTNWRTGEVKYIDNQVAVIKADDIDRPFVYEFDRVELNPIETQAEKAQRLEDEFVKSDMKDTTVSSEWACIYERGVRAAYRKLKGGE